MAAIEQLRRHRSALAADRERVREVVCDLLDDAFARTAPWLSVSQHRAIVDAIANRATDQLATAAVGMGEADRRELDELLSYLAGQRAEADRDGLSGTAAAFDAWHAALAKLLGANK